jgi:pimeloyl-ACP methyl ester carboxylesterase
VTGAPVSTERACDVVLLHGALGAAVQFAPLVPLLASRYRVHTLDFEGHGTRPGERPFAMQHFAENVLAWLDERGIARTNLIGYSMGGYVALLLAAAHPERIGDVATLGTKLRWDPEAADREARRLDPAAIRAKVPLFADALAERHAGAGGWEGVLARTAALLRSLGERPALSAAELGTVRQRVRVMVGDRDATMAIDEAVDAYRALPAGELAVLPATPHPLEQIAPARLAAAIVDFLG